LSIVQPIPPKPDQPEPPRGAWLSILLTLGVGSLLAGALSMVTMFYLVPVFAVAAVVFLAGAFHYFVWGWWMRSFLDQTADEDEPIDPGT
jgi:membrane protein DedA with SNARE-associated domain